MRLNPKLLTSTCLITSRDADILAKVCISFTPIYPIKNNNVTIVR